MIIAVGSAFRNAEHYALRYMQQVQRLKEHAGPNHQVRVIAVEGDSTDRTREALLGCALTCGLDLDLRTCNHGHPPFGSTESPIRLAALSEVGNTILNAVRSTDDVLLYVESDLLWDSHTVGTLIDMAMRRDEDFDIFAPMIFAGPLFYDVFAYRKNGERFIPFHPYHIALKDGLTEVDSCGSCLAMRAEVASVVRIPDGNALIGWCDEARRQGFHIAVQPQLRVMHPA